ncbi:MAG TPA: hypothetical protein VGD42_18460 [Lysobacter sp.]
MFIAEAWRACMARIENVADFDKATVPKVAAGVTRHGGDRACQIVRLAEIVTPDGAGVQLRAMISL